MRANCEEWNGMDVDAVEVNGKTLWKRRRRK